MEYIWTNKKIENKRYKNKIDGEFYRVTEVTENYNLRQIFLTLTNENDENNTDIMIATSMAFFDTYDLVDDNGVPLIDYSYKQFTIPNGIDKLPLFVCNLHSENSNKINELIDKVNKLTSEISELKKKLNEKEENKNG